MCYVAIIQTMFSGIGFELLGVYSSEEKAKEEILKLFNTMLEEVDSSEYTLSINRDYSFNSDAVEIEVLSTTSHMEEDEEIPDWNMYGYVIETDGIDVTLHTDAAEEYTKFFS